MSTKKKVPANRMHDSIVRGYKDESGNPADTEPNTFYVHYTLPRGESQVILGGWNKKSAMIY